MADVVKTPPKRRNFLFSCKPEMATSLFIDNLVECVPRYAYILHDKDEGVDPHYHFYVEYVNPRSFESVSEEIGVPVSQLQKVKDKRGTLMYLMHRTEQAVKDCKTPYAMADITTNLDATQFAHKLEGAAYVDSAIYHYKMLKAGKIKWEDVLKAHDAYCAT